MLLVTVVSILTGSNMFTVLLEYINVFNHNGNIKQVLGRGCLSLASHYHIFKPILKFVARFGFVHSVFSYSLFGIPNRLALDFMLVVAEI